MAFLCLDSQYRPTQVNKHTKSNSESIRHTREERSSHFQSALHFKTTAVSKMSHFSSDEDK